MILADYHVHTNFCDGLNTPEEVVLSAIQKGIKELGFSVHSYTFFDCSYCIKKERVEEYVQEINRLKKRYEKDIKIYCGVEQDYYSDYPTDSFDYVIGSAHYLYANGKYYPLDDSKEDFIRAVNEGFGGDYYALTDAYFNVMADMINKTGADVVGHLDIVTKFNLGGVLFDEKNPRYVAGYRRAVDQLVKQGAVFEVNTGGILRGYKDCPYPSRDILEYIAKKGAKVVLSSDTHTKDGLCFEFDKWDKVLEEFGLK